MSFEEICKELNLENTPDWGITNSDGYRVSEFINYILTHDSLESNIKFEFLELIIASMNDAIIEGLADCELYSKFYSYLKPIIRDKRYYPIIPYWIRIKSKDEFPVGYLLEEYLNKSK